MADGKKYHAPTAAERLALAAMGMEAEFALNVDGAPARPEKVFRTPLAFLSGAPMHREGTSYHLPTGGAVYFDTGVIEVATPVIEIERGCAARAGRSLWESIHHVRDGLDRWEAREGRQASLAGFSAHYSVSFDLPEDRRSNGRSVESLAWLLSHVLPVPVMLLATNRRSTGVGVRPRRDRVEVTVDFTPSPSLMIATGTLIVGVSRAIMDRDGFDTGQLAEMGVPVIRGYEPVPHTSRKGWLARFSCFPANPFTAEVDRAVWETEDHGVLSLRQIARRTVRAFWPSIRRVSDPFTFRLIASILRGRSPSLLELPDRPAEYEDVGRLCMWDRLFPAATLTRSRYERVLIRAISGHHLRVGGVRLRPVGMRGWSAVVFRREPDGAPQVIPIDRLVGHLDAWERD
jgi:hypothetical protein